MTRKHSSTISEPLYYKSISPGNICRIKLNGDPVIVLEHRESGWNENGQLLEGHLYYIFNITHEHKYSIRSSKVEKIPYGSKITINIGEIK